MILHACHLGTLGYRAGLELQEGLVNARAAGETGDWLLFPDHPPVLTVGRGQRPGGLKVDLATLRRMGIELFEVTRGGDVTWHGPGQLVGYPVLGLDGRGRDLHRYLRGLEDVICKTLSRFGIDGRAEPGRTGVWVAGEKIASIGIAVRKWVSYHGFALNVDPDLAGFDLIHPCGLRGINMTSMAARLGGQGPSIAAVREAVAGELAAHFGYEGVTWEAPVVARDAARRSNGRALAG